MQNNNIIILQNFFSIISILILISFFVFNILYNKRIKTKEDFRIIKRTYPKGDIGYIIQKRIKLLKIPFWIYRRDEDFNEINFKTQKEANSYIENEIILSQPFKDEIINGK